ncbi:hypothetical protein GN956_G3786 [Arapaima gigas]
MPPQPVTEAEKKLLRVGAGSAKRDRGTAGWGGRQQPSGRSLPATRRDPAWLPARAALSFGLLLDWRERGGQGFISWGGLLGIALAIHSRPDRRFRSRRPKRDKTRFSGPRAPYLDLSAIQRKVLSHQEKTYRRQMFNVLVSLADEALPSTGRCVMEKYGLSP